MSISLLATARSPMARSAVAPSANSYCWVTSGRRPAWWGFGDGAGGEADGDQPSLGGQAPQALLEHLPTNRIDDDVDTSGSGASSRGRTHARTEAWE